MILPLELGAAPLTLPRRRSDKPRRKLRGFSFDACAAAQPINCEFSDRWYAGEIAACSMVVRLSILKSAPFRTYGRGRGDVFGSENIHDHESIVFGSGGLQSLSQLRHTPLRLMRKATSKPR
jgi:hypothetical protein